MEGLDRPKVGEWRDTKGFYGASIPLAWAQDGRRQGLKIETQRTCAANVCLPQHVAPQYGFQDFQRSLPGLKSTTPWVFKRLLKNVGHVEDPRRDIILTFKMNGEPLPADHGAPLRCLVPGVAGARSVKWLNKLIAPWHYEMSWTVGRGESRSFLILFWIFMCVTVKVRVENIWLYSMVYSISRIYHDRSNRYVFNIYIHEDAWRNPEIPILIYNYLPYLHSHICLHCQSFKFEVDMPYTGKPNTWGNAELLSLFQVASEESQSHWQQMLDMFKLKQLARWHSEDQKGYLFAWKYLETSSNKYFAQHLHSPCRVRRADWKKRYW